MDSTRMASTLDSSMAPQASKNVREEKEESKTKKPSQHEKHRPASDLIQIKIIVCQQLREELQLSARERRGRVFLDPSLCVTMKSLCGVLHGFFAALRRDSYVLKVFPPNVSPDGSVLAIDTEDSAQTIATDDDVRMLLDTAQKVYEKEEHLSRPTMCLRIEVNPNRPAPPPIPSYLQNLPDPSTSTHMTMLSFYAFPANGIDDPDAFAHHLRKTWQKPYQAVGRIYVAREGVNAQMAVPTNVLDPFIESCHDLPNKVGDYLTKECLGVNVDPIPLSRADFATAGVNDGPPFHNLHIRVRPQVVSDGLEQQEFNWNDAGYDMPPEEWHEHLQTQDDITLLDCRNSYESDVGRFARSDPLNTETFKDTWDALKDRLQDKPKDAPIYTYCTGGIRCVKVGAYLTQELGFTNVNRLAGGIIAYDRTVNKDGNSESLFKGTNFVFDGRLGRPITDEKLGTCVTCGASTSLVTNCRNSNCHQRIVQCETCGDNYLGTCSDACHNRVLKSQGSAEEIGLGDEDGSDDANNLYEDAISNCRVRSDASTVTSTTSRQFSSLEDYSAAHSSPVPAIYPELNFNSAALIPTGSHMVSGEAVGRFLQNMVRLQPSPARILEVGTFTGYATAWLWGGLFSDEKTNDGRQPYLLTMERDPKAFAVAVEHMRCIAEHGCGESAAEASCALRSTSVLSTVSERPSRVSFTHENSTCELWKVTDALASLESDDFADSEPFDLIFLDADKTRLVEYMEAFLCNDRLLRKGGSVVVDNVLWKGLVLDAAAGGIYDADHESTNEELRRNRRARKLANKMHRFNTAMANDDRVEVLVLPVRDGLSVIRKK